MIFKILRLVNRLVVVLLLLSSALVFVMGISSYLYQDQITQAFLRKLNKQLNYSVQINAAQLTFLKSFPYVGISLQEVVVKDSKSATKHLAAISEVHLALNMWKLLQGKYVIGHLSLSHGKVYLAKDLIKQLHGEQQEPGKLLIPKLHNITFRDVVLVYYNEKGSCSFDAIHLKASPSWTPEGLAVTLGGQLKIRGIRHEKTTFAEGLPLQLQASLYYNQRDGTWRLQDSQVKYGNSHLMLQGIWGREGKIPTTLTVWGKDIAPQFFIRCFPRLYYQQLKAYNLHGQLSLKLAVTKKKKCPWALQGNVSVEKGAIAMNACTQPIVCDTLLAVLKVPDAANLSTACFHIKKLEAAFAKSKLTGQFTIADFECPYLQADAQATLDVGSLNTIFPQKLVKDASGEVALSVNLNTRLDRLLQGTMNCSDMKLTGDAQAKAIHFKWGSAQLPFHSLTGRLVFQDDTWNFQELTGNIGPGHFRLIGRVDNPLHQLFAKHRQCHVAAKLDIDYLDLDAILSDSHKRTDFFLSPWWSLNLDYDIQQLHLRRFKSHNVRGHCSIKDQCLKVDQPHMRIANGKVALNGILDASMVPLTIKMKTKLQGLRLSKLFYMFENFNQHFLEDRHLSGEVFADIDLMMKTDRKWQLDQDQLQASIDMRLKGGMLQAFEPMQHLKEYVAKNNSLDKLRFSELKNHIKIQNRVIYIPPMEVHSNVTRMQVSGIHTFDGKINYKLVVPFTGLQRLREIPEDIAPDALGGLNLFLTVKGHVNDYKVTHDAKALQRSLKDKIKQQKQTLQELLKGQYKVQEKHKELADDYLELD